MAKKNRVPQKHIETIKEVSRQLGEAPRYSLARSLSERIGVSHQTSLDYILSSIVEGHLEKIGMNYRVKHESQRCREG